MVDIGFGIGVDSDAGPATTLSEPRASLDSSRWCASPRENASLMDLLGTSINAAVVAVVGALLAWLARGRFDALDRRIDRLETRLVGTETRLDGRIEGMETGLDGRFDRMESRIDGVESRLGSRIDGVESRLGSSIDGLESRFDGVESRFDGRFDALQSSMDAMRSDLTQVALAVGVRPRAQND
jgi:hypothetical protein